MQAYTAPIIIAVAICLILANFLTIPFAVWQYRKYGFFSFWKSILIFSFIFYCLCAYFLVVYPVPGQWDNCADVSANALLVQTHPFQFINDIKVETAFQWTVPSSYLQLLKAPAFYTRAFNVLLLFPLGVYVRYFFKKKRKWFYATLIAFGVSLFFELTQRTALYGLFKCPYRVFDVDDLIANTAGAVIGFFIAPIILALIPSRNHLNEQMRLYQSKKDATYGAQLFEVLLNIVLARFVTSFITNISHVVPDDIVYLVVFYVLMVVVPVVWKGQTIGAKIIRMKLSANKGSNLGALNRRFWLVYLPFMFAAFSRALPSQTVDGIYVQLFVIGLLLLSVLVWLVYIGHILIRWMKKERTPFFNRYANLEASRIGRKKE